MDERCLSILSKINSSKEITIAELSKELGVSTRTVRYDLDKIDVYLNTNTLPPLIRNQKGIRLEREQDGIQGLWNFLKSTNLVSYFPSQRERIQRIQLELLFADGYLTMERMCQILGVSRSTVVNDLKSVKLDFRKAGIDLHSKPRYGFQLASTEQKLREKVISIMLELLPANEFIGFLNETKNKGHRGLTKVNYLEFFKDINLELIYKVTKRMEKKLEVIWSDYSFTRIAYTIAVCLKRKEKRDQIDFSSEQLIEIESARDYGIVVNSLLYHGLKYVFDLSRVENGIIALAVLCADTNNITYYKKENQIKIQIIAAKIIKETGEKLEFDFTLNDTLSSILSEHLSHAYYRIKYGVPCENQVYSEIGYRYKRIIRALKDSLKQFETLSGHKVPEREIAGIAALFCGEYYGNTEKMRRYKILIVTGEGIAVSSFLSAKLTAVFPEIDIMAVLTKHQMTAKALFEKADFIVTTVPLDLFESKSILVNPILDEDNISVLKNFISQNPPKKGSSGSHHQDAFAKVLSIAGRVCPRSVYDQLIAELVEEIGPIDNRYYHQRCDIMLRNLLTADTISLGVSVNTWEEAVRWSGDLMVKANCVEPGFVDAMVKFVKVNGPYVVIAPGIAIPHARPEDGVKKMCISLITLTNPVEFGSEDNDPVDLVIGLAAVDNSSHLDALAELIEILGDNQKNSIIRNAKSATEIMVLFK